MQSHIFVKQQKISTWRFYSNNVNDYHHQHRNWLGTELWRADNKGNIKRNWPYALPTRPPQLPNLIPSSALVYLMTRIVSDEVASGERNNKDEEKQQQWRHQWRRHWGVQIIWWEAITMGSVGTTQSIQCPFLYKPGSRMAWEFYRPPSDLEENFAA